MLERNFFEFLKKSLIPPLHGGPSYQGIREITLVRVVNVNEEIVHGPIIGAYAKNVTRKLTSAPLHLSPSQRRLQSL